MISFTKEQLRIFQFVEQESGHGIIDAVAGAGKTTTIMECVKFVKKDCSTLFCAFNNSIANEISKKFHRLNLHEVTVRTIHSLGWHIIQDNNASGQPIKVEENKYRELLKTDAIQFKLKPYYSKILKINGFDIDDLDEKQRFAANNLVSRINLKLIDINQKYRATLLKDEISEFENLVLHFGIFNEIDIKKRNYKDELAAYFESHKIILKAGNDLSGMSMIIDYTDMLYLPHEWKQHPIRKYDFLFIDECQDLSKSQLAITLKYGKRDSRILAVGDPRQSIYGFTGADIESFKRVKDTTKAIELPLTTCFRCPKKIVELAKTIRADIVSNKENEGLIKSIDLDEAIKIAKPGDLIISRLKAPIVLLVFCFIDLDIKVHIHVDEVKEIINEIKGIFKQNELNILISTLSDGFQDLKNDVVKRWNWIILKNAERIKEITERNIFIENEKKYLVKRLDFLHKKYEQWKNDCDTLNDVLRRIMDYISAEENAIKLSTIHRAKGLENEIVFILNYDELPYFRPQQKEWERTQEVNLKYVAITRALKELYLIENKKIESILDEGSLFDILPFD